QMQRLGKLLAEQNLSIKLDNKARNYLAKKGYDPAYGARPLQRVIQREVQDPLARMILNGDFADGDKISLSAKDDALLINGKALVRR
ncbi:ClpB protein, partial [hydrothermal vent metagenome]